MADIIAVVLPVFLIIGAGYAASATGRLSSSAVDGIIAFAVRFGVPSLLFSHTYSLELGALFDVGMLLGFYIGAVAAAGLALLAGRRAGRRPGEAVAVGFCALFSNTVLAGLPIVSRAYREPGVEIMLSIIVFHAPLLYTIGIVSMEITRQGGAGAAAALKSAAAKIASNALTIAIALGLGLNLAGVPLPGPVIDATRSLGDASLATALFGIGGALTRYALAQEARLAAIVAGLGLIAHPAITWAIAGGVFGAPAAYVSVAVLTAAMPSGMNIYVFASLYNRSEDVAAGVILISTAASIVTISLWLAVLSAVYPIS